MTEHIDRAFAASDLIVLASRVRSMANSGQFPPTQVEAALASASLTMAEAQVHATLAIAEQLRIANLIALATATHPMLSEQVAEDAARTLAVFVPHSMGGYFHVRPDIAAALGIEIAAT